jgi:hypothetical protein
MAPDLARLGTAKGGARRRRGWVGEWRGESLSPCCPALCSVWKLCGEAGLQGWRSRAQPYPEDQPTGAEQYRAAVVQSL